MKSFARINLSAAALRRGILVSSPALEGSGKCENIQYPVSIIQ